MPRPREYDDDLRERLVDAAGELLAAEGPQALSTRRIAAEVGTSTTAIYSLLGSKGELVRAMFAEGFGRLARVLGSVPYDDDPVAHIAALGHAYLDSALASPHLYRVMFERPFPDFQPPAEELLLSLSTLQVLIDAAGRAVDAARLPGPAEELALELWALTHGLASVAISGMAGPPERAREHLDRMMAAQLAGYEAVAARARGVPARTE